jgi:polysaccharide biosynthesis protein PslH
MRILWVNVDGLWPLNTGGRLRSFHIIEELSRRHRVTVVTAHGPQGDPAGLAARLTSCERVISVPYTAPKHGTARFARALVRSWFSPLPVHIRKWRSPAVRQEVARLLAAQPFDLCVADFLISTPNVLLDGPVATVLFSHNVEHMIWKRLSQVESRPWRRALLELEWRKMRRYEAQTCTRLPLTVAVSDADRAVLAAHAPQARVCAVPTGVDTAYFTPNGTEQRSGALVFTGAMDWFPNEDGIAHFVEVVFPRIRAAVPDASLTVVGRNPGPRVQRLAAVPGVHITGTVNDVRPYVARGAVYVVPLRVGGVLDGGGGGPAAHAGDALRPGGRAGTVRRLGRGPAPGSGSAPRAGQRRTEPGGAAVLVVARGAGIRGQMQGGDPTCALTCSGSATWDP